MMSQTQSHHFGIGEEVYDIEQEPDDSQAVVVGYTNETASEHYVSAVDATVAESNPEYPADDLVAEIVFLELIQDDLGLLHKAAEIAYSTNNMDVTDEPEWADENTTWGECYAHQLRNHSETTIYTYPESRLAAYER